MLNGTAKNGDRPSVELENLVGACALSMMVLSVVLGDLVNACFSTTPSSLWSILAFGYVGGYLYILTASRLQFDLRTILFLVVIIKTYLFCLSVFSGNMIEEARGASDWARFHIPYSLEVLSEGNLIQSLFSAGMSFNGRLTHVIIIIFSTFLDSIGLNGQSPSNIAFVAGFLSIFAVVVTLRLYFIAAYQFSSSTAFACRSVFFLGLHPFFLTVTSNPQKEMLLFFALGCILVYLTKPSRSVNWFLFGCIILAFERIYLLPLVIAVLFFQPGYRLFKLMAGFGCLMLIEVFVGVEDAIGHYLWHRQSLVGVGGSILPGEGFFSNLIRGLFGPFGLRPFMGIEMSHSVLGTSKYLTFFYFAIFPFFAVLYARGLNISIALVYAFFVALLPFHGTAKLFSLLVFGCLFLDHVSFVKYTR